jgi:hypothetical protein
LKQKRHTRREVAPGTDVNSAGEAFQRKNKAKLHGINGAPALLIKNYEGPLQATYETVWTKPRRIDWCAMGLTPDELRQRSLPRYTCEGMADWLPDNSRPYYLLDELVLTAFRDLPVLPLWLYIPEHLTGDPTDCHLDNLKWTLSDKALEAHGLRRRSLEERESALINPRQGHCKASA